MKLRNKKTGEIKELLEVANNLDNGKNTFTLTELNEEWEDYEVPEGWWFIDRCYEAHVANSTLRNIVADKEIGNYFETKEEAELAVEKLKAWKRLKDKGMNFIGWEWNVGRDEVVHVTTSITNEQIRAKQIEITKDLSFVFGDEE